MEWSISRLDQIFVRNYAAEGSRKTDLVRCKHEKLLAHYHQGFSPLF